MSRFGLVLGGGGITGDAFHRGVLRALAQAGYDGRTADVIVGTSAGAMVGATLRRPDRAAVVPLDSTVHGRRLGRAPDLAPLLGAALRPWRLRPGVLTSLLPTGRHSTEVLVRQLRHQHGARWPERDLYVCAVRRHDGRRVVFGRPGAPDVDVAHAVAASIAIPGYFHPVEIAGEMYVDGGVHSPTNADVLRHSDLDVVVVSSPMSVDPAGMRPALDLGLRYYWHRVLRREVRMLRRLGMDVITIEPSSTLVSVMGVNPMMGARMHQVEQAAAAHAAEVLAEHARLDPAGNVTRLRRA